MFKASMFSFVLVLYCAGCSGATSHQIMGPNGSLSWRLTCHPDVAECWEEASNRCNAGYNVVVEPTMHWGGTLIDLMPGPVPWYNVMVSCK
jgi:hypothetical protein